MDMEHYKIFSGDKKFEASEYQDKIFHAVEKGVGNLIINAAAGSAKTTTIINAIRYISSDKKILFVAFNKDVVSKIKHDIKHENTNVFTFHSLGYYILLENGIIRKRSADNSIINEYKYKNYIKENISAISGTYATLGKSKTQYINNIIKLVDYSRYYMSMSPKEISNVAEIYDITPVSDEYEICRKILLWGKDNTDSIDYTDLLWLPNILNLTTKRYQYNWIFIDEAQDTSVVEQKLIEKCFRRGTRFAAVMDEHQQINIWCGSSTSAIDNFKKHPNTREYALPISYRCPKKIVELAKEYSDNIVALDSAEDGEIKYNCKPNEPIAGDMVLCRTTAPLVEQFIKYLRINKKAYIRGFENAKDEYLDLVISSKSKIIDRNCMTCDGLFPKLYTKLFDEIDRIRQAYGLDEDDTLSHQTILSMYDNIEALKVLSEGLLETDELISKINTIFNGDETDAVELSTIHKAKGLEADNVYILMPSLMPSKFAKKEWEIKTERNLMYVAYTRAKKTLNFISEVDSTSRTGSYMDIWQMKKQINTLKIQLNYNKENAITEENIEFHPQKQEIKQLKTEKQKEEIQEKQAAPSNNKNNFRRFL